MPEARAVYQLMTGQRFVRLDPLCPATIASSATVARTLLQLQPTHLMSIKDIRFASTQPAVRRRIARELAGQLTGPDGSIAQVWEGNRALGSPSRDSFRMVFVDTVAAWGTRTNLLVAGFEDRPWRCLPAALAAPEVQWAGAARGNQVLIVGPRRPWETGYFEGLLHHDHASATIPWGDRIPPEVLIAGAD